jgi:hypothetical protein
MLKMKRGILSALLFLTSMYIPLSTFAIDLESEKKAPIKEMYELQERCGKQAEDFFQTDFLVSRFRDNQFKGSVDYTIHYNRKLNKCFIVIRAHFLYETIEEMENPSSVDIGDRLIDVNEKREYGCLIKTVTEQQPLVCWVRDAFKCNLESEWESLVKPFMEE